MKNDLEPIIIDLPEGKDAVIYPVSDLHYGSLQFNRSAWDCFVQKIKEDENAYIFILGDLIDNGTATSVTLPYEQTAAPSEQKRWVAEQLKPIKDKIIAGVGGNHERRNSAVDDDPLYDIFAKLDIENKYRENGAFVICRLGYDRARAGKDRPCYSFFLGHGAGGGMYVGSGANKLERYICALDGVDCIVTGHTHKPLQFPVAKAKLDQHNKQVIITRHYCVTASSWLGYGGYAMRKLLSPTAQVSQAIHLSSKGKQITLSMT